MQEFAIFGQKLCKLKLPPKFRQTIFFTLFLNFFKMGVLASNFAFLDDGFFDKKIMVIFQQPKFKGDNNPLICHNATV